LDDVVQEITEPALKIRSWRDVLSSQPRDVIASEVNQYKRAQHQQRDLSRAFSASAPHPIVTDDVFLSSAGNF